MRGLFQNLFQKWVIVYSTQNIDQFYKAKARLDENNITYKTDSMSTGGGISGRNGFATTYHIKVKEDYLNISSDVIHR
ncbi:hypothetical protein [Virgibacillus doumboii]|uniref:hypothetical protein n=1 Tax=Virgibacillus doumboii TaxID=2697503 RepID=UPI0013E0574F|nr:hypothetical protein [Virgibacillus doumboii]